MALGALRVLPILSVVLAACGGGGGPAGDAGRDADGPDAGRDAQPPRFDAGPILCPVACLGLDSGLPFKATDGTSVRISAGGALELEQGEAEGELRHVFDEQCDGDWTVWHSVTISGALDGVELGVRGGQSLEELEEQAWQSVASGVALPTLDPGASCGPRLLDVRLVLRASGAVSGPRVDSLSVCYGCTQIFC